MLLLFLLGISLGSFLNVVGLRIPKKESIVTPPSTCQNCGYRLKPYDLIPIFSYMLLGGRCRSCKVSYSIFYPIIELITGLGFLFFYIYSENLVVFIFNVSLFSIMISLTVSDIKYQLVPDKILLFTGLTLFPFVIFLEYENYIDHLLTGIGFFSFLFLIAVISKGGIGGGDIKLFGVLGFLLGFEKTFIAFFISTFLGAIIGIILKRKNNANVGIPFVPYIMIGTSISLIYGEKIMYYLINF